MRHVEQMQGWSAGLEAMATEMAQVQAELSESSDAPRRAADNVGAAYDLLEEARMLLRSTSLSLGASSVATSDDGSDSETWSAAITASIGKGYGDPNGEVPA